MKPRIYGLEHEYAIFCQKLAITPEWLVDIIMDVFADNFIYLCSRHTMDRNRSFFLQNGARFYNDQSHPEFCTPETTSPLETAKYAKAEERILDYLLLKMTEHPKVKLEDPGRIFIFKNNVDCQESPETYGCHENYSVCSEIHERLINHSPLSSILISFFVSRQVICGSGCIEYLENGWKYRINQRTPFINREISRDSRHCERIQKGIIDARDEHFSKIKTPALKRLHIMLSDSNMSEFMNYLKMGTTALILEMMEEYFLTDRDFYKLALKCPLECLQIISHDLSLKKRGLITENDRKFTALEIQEMFFEKAQKFFQRSNNHLVKKIINDWGNTLCYLKNDLFRCFGTVDWITKKLLIEEGLQKIKKRWGKLHKIKSFDLRYHDIKHSEGLYYIIENRGKTKKLFSDLEISQAKTNAPINTRAFIRGEIVKEATEKKWQNYIELDWGCVRLWHPFDTENYKLCLYLNDPFDSNWPRIKESLSYFFYNV